MITEDKIKLVQQHLEAHSRETMYMVTRGGSRATDREQRFKSVLTKTKHGIYMGSYHLLAAMSRCTFMNMLKNFLWHYKYAACKRDYCDHCRAVC